MRKQENEIYYIEFLHYKKLKYTTLINKQIYNFNSSWCKETAILNILINKNLSLLKRNR